MTLLLLASLAGAQTAPPDPIEALSAGEVNVDHFYNLGLSFETQGQIPQAALSYRRGLMLAPNDGPVQERLATLSALPESGPALGPKWSGWLGVLSMAGALLLLAAQRMRAKGWTLALLALPLALLGGALINWTWSTLESWGAQGLVLESAVVTSQVGEGGQALFELSPLQTVEILAVGEGALQIQTEDGRVGWMPQAALGVLDPRAGASSLR